jgi:tetratricopeptide (TPR) repeat protein
VEISSKNPSRSNSAAAGWYNIFPVLLLCIFWVLVNAFLVDAVTVRLCDQADAGIAKELRMPVFLHEIANDGYVWNRHAEHVGENGQWRVRHTDFDNAPAGREVHWNSAFAWYLRGLGELYRSSTGDTLRNSIFRMSIWANPILLVLALGIFTTIAARRFGPLCGSVIAIGMVAVPTFYEGFLPAYPDHHGLIAFAILGMIFGIAWAGAGWVQAETGEDFVLPRSMRQARHGMIFSAICGAAGLWISAISTAVVLATIGAAVVVAAAALGRKLRREGLVFDAGLWRLWTLWGAGAGVFFYLFEYFPSNMGMRLEINHPLYALAWLGGGWIIAHLTHWLCSLGQAENPFPWRKLIGPLAACAVLPLVVLGDGAAVYIPFDPFMAGLWKNIRELLSLSMIIKLSGSSWFATLGWFPVLVLLAGVLVTLRRVGTGTKAVLIFLPVPILLITGLQLYQVRWGMLSGPLYIALAGIVIPQFWRIVPRALWCRMLAIPALLVFGYQFVVPSFQGNIGSAWAQYRNPQTLSFGQGIALLHRQIARNILDSANGKPVVLLSSPNSSCMLAALGGFRTIGTLYWENVDGLKAAAEGLNAQSEVEAFDFMKKHGVTHVSLMNWENFIEPYFNILHPVPAPGVSVQNSFGKAALSDRRIPAWVRPLVFPANSLSQNLQQTVLLLQVVPDQSANEAQFHLARFVRYVEGRPEQAEKLFKDILIAEPASSLVMVELMNLYLAQKRYDEAVEQLLNALPDANADTRAALAGQVASELGKVGQWPLIAKVLRRTVEFPDTSAQTLQNVAWLIATLPTPDSRDPRFALACCDRLDRLPNDPAMLALTRAVSQAALGDFPAASQLALDVASGRIPSNEERRRQATEMAASFKANKLWLTAP